MIPINEPYSDGEYGLQGPCGLGSGGEASCLMSPRQAGFKTSFRWLPVKCQPSLLGIGGAQWDAQLPGSTHTQLVPLG